MQVALCLLFKLFVIYTAVVYQVLSTAIPSLTLLHQSDIAVCCKRLLPYAWFIWEWKSAGLSPTAHRNWMMQHCMCQDESISLLHWATHCWAEITQCSMLMKCAYCGWSWPLPDGERMINITWHITWQYILPTYLLNNLYNSYLRAITLSFSYEDEPFYAM